MDTRQIFENYSFKLVGKLFELYKGNLKQLSEDEVDVVRIWRLEADMYNGGFIQFFCNWGYNNFIETKKVLVKLNAKKSLDLLTECENIISKARTDKRIEKLWDIPVVLPEYLTKNDFERLDELDELYWTDLDDLQHLAYMKYLKK